MRIPYVIDNQTHALADVLNALLAEYVGHSLDIATAYLNTGATGCCADSLAGSVPSA